MKKQTGIAKDQYKSFKDQINVINNNREDDVKTEYGVKTEDNVKIEDSKMIDEVHSRYIDDKKTHGLKDEDLHPTNFIIMPNFIICEIYCHIIKHSKHSRPVTEIEDHYN